MTSPATDLDRFRELVEADAALQEQLNAPDDPAVFMAMAVETASRYGLDITAGQLETAMQPSPHGAAPNHARRPPAGWIPDRAWWQDRELWIDWTYLGPRRLREPLFEETIARCRTRPLNQWLRYATPLGALADWLRQHPGVPPAGFIFHMSRCGSTLVSQMLAAVPNNVVVSEASPIDAVVRAQAIRPELDRDQHAQWLRWIVGALGQPRSGAERHFFVKLDAWHSLALPLFRRAFPDLPWIFLYRDPVEVLVSQLRRRGIHTVPGLIGGDVFGLDTTQATLAPEQVCAQVLGRICQGALRDYVSGGGMLVNYRQLPGALWTDILPHFGVTCSAADRAVMAEAAGYDAKQPESTFSPDGAAKQAQASDRVRSATADLDGLYAASKLCGRPVNDHGPTRDHRDRLAARQAAVSPGA